ncbi:MAG: glycosyltransferase family 4 protein [Bacteroidia bacterium]|nr:glycosyltransferase family 4 protein [Bacteroidia bacterium]
MSNKPKVIFATDGVFPHSVGGIQRHSRLLIETLAAQAQVELTVIHPHQGERVFDSELNITEIHVDPLPQRRNYLLELYQYSRQVHQVLMEHPDHLVYAQGLTVWYKLKDFADRLIVNPHGLEPYQPLTQTDYLKGMPYRIILDGIFKRSRHVVSLGGRLSDIMAKRTSSKSGSLQVLPNAVAPPADWEEVHPKWEKIPPMKCLFVGRWAYNKGIDTLMAAIEMISAEGREDDFQFSLAGKGPLWEELSKKPIKADILGFVSDEQLDELYRNTHVFVLPTKFEGMPTVVLESMVHGSAVLVTDVGATRELVDESNGEIIPKNDPAYLKEALYRLYALGGEAWASIYHASKEKVKKNFTWEAVARKHTDLFQALWKEVHEG